MTRKRVLFVCVHNSARSQMAAAYLRALGGDRFESESAGLEPGKLNPLAVEAMRRDGVDISKAPTQSVFELFKTGRRYEYVVSVCDGAAAERCPIFPGVTKRLNWSFDDPAGFTGPEESRLARTIAVRDKIRTEVDRFVQTEAHSATFGRSARE
jgi:arsenate reductase (thioredoxin)